MSEARRTADEVAEELRATGVRAVDAVTPVLLERFGAADLNVSAKSSPADVVTDADLIGERLVREAVLAERPGDAFIGEEGTNVGGTSGITWVLDPIDSTANFARGIPIWSVSLAAMDSSGTVAGVVAFPPGREVISGTTRSGVLLNGRAVEEVRPPVQIGGSMIAIGWGPRTSGRRQAQVAGAVIHRVGKVRSPGSPALGLAWTALGRFDAAYYEMGFSEWDVAAGAFLCECAGLAVRHRPPDADDGSPRLLAARPELVDDLAHLLFE